MSAVSRRAFLQSSAAVAGVAAVAGSAGRAAAAERNAAATTLATSSSTDARSGDDGTRATGPIIAYVDGSTVTLLRGERETTRRDADLARRITRAAGKED